MQKHWKNCGNSVARRRLTESLTWDISSAMKRMVPGGGNKRRQTDVVQLTVNHSYRSGKIKLAEFRRSISFDLFENTGKMITRGKSAFTGNFRNASVGIAKQNRRLQSAADMLYLHPYNRRRHHIDPFKSCMICENRFQYYKLRLSRLQSLLPENCCRST